MKFSLFHDYKQAETVPQKQIPFLVLTIAVLMTGTIFVWSIQQAYRASRSQDTTRERAAKIEELRISGANFGETSARAAKIAAAAGDLRWEEIYRESEPRLTQAIQEAKNLADGEKENSLVGQIVAAQEKSEEIENRAFDLLRDGKTEQARAILSGDEYETQRKNYSDALAAYLAELDGSQTSQASNSTQNALWLLAAEIILLAFFLWSWLAVIDNLRKSRKVLLAQIAENNKAHRILNQSEERFRSIIETTSEWIWAIDTEKRITYSNPAIEKILGCDAEELYGTSFLLLIDEEDREKVEQDFAQCVAGKSGWENVVHRWLHCDGEVRYLESSGVPVFDSNGNLTGYRGTNHDITERRQAVEELQKNVALLSSTFEATDDGIMVVDLNNSIVTYNKNFTKMWNLPEEILCSRENGKAIEHAVSQLINGKEFAENTRQLILKPEVKSHDVLFFEDGKIFERYSQPHIMEGKIAGRILSFRDTTERRRAERALLESQESYQQLFDSNPHPIWVYDFETLQILAVNNEAMRHYGYSREEFLQMTLKDIRPAKDIPALMNYISKISADQIETTHPTRHRKKDGKIIDVEVATRPIIFAGKHSRLTLATDITNRRLADAALRESEYKLRTLLDNMNEGLSQVDNNEVIEFVNDRFCEMTGYLREELTGKSTFNIFLDEDGRRIVDEANEKRLKGISSQYELRLKKKSGEVLWAIVGGAPILNAEGKMTGTMGVFTDITERKRAEEQMLHDALHDGLTGLANRTLFTNHLQKAIERGKRSSSTLYAVLFLDFDRFKVINDSLGHAEGDNLLKQIARRLENLLRIGDLLARLGGDEFTILLSELNETNDAVAIAERIQKDLNTPFILGEQEIFMSVSIGIALSNDGHYRAEDMLRDADIAMYRAKAKGKAQHQIFDQAMHSYARNKLQLETEMHHALQRGEFCLNYQPIINIETNNLAGFEALIRWNHPERGMVSPGDFIPAAEENGLIIPLGRWILYESCRQMYEWQKLYPWASEIMMSVNLSCKQFMQSDLMEQVAASIISTQLDPRCLKLEITESHVMENSEKAVTMMNRLRSIGVGISLDDFGTGYSSLSYLHRLPVNYLKIDRSFVSRMVESKENREIVYTIVKLAQNLKMKVVAEGIETAEQLEQLKQIGCEFGQGYLISKPMESEKAKIYLNKFAKPQFVPLDAPVINAELNM
ncbi:MAG: EAL domain-containing protein [Pyrinomonadaceae bacterium]